MKEITGNIWEQKCDWLCITTNGIVKNSGNSYLNGEAVMGAGIAKQAKERYPDLPLKLGKKIKEKGNVVSCLGKRDGKWIISFPTKNDWKDKSSIELIKQSASQLKNYFDKQEVKPVVIIPRPGCANGGLNWEDVKKEIENILVDDNFLIISQG